MNSNRAYMYDYCSGANDFFILFISLLGYPLICLLLTTRKGKSRWGHVSSDLSDITKKLKKYYYLNKIDNRIYQLI